MNDLTPLDLGSISRSCPATALLCSQCFDAVQCHSVLGLRPQSVCERCGKLCMGYFGEPREHWVPYEPVAAIPEPKILVTDGILALTVNGRTIAMPVEHWHELALKCQ